MPKQLNFEIRKREVFVSSYFIHLCVTLDQSGSEAVVLWGRNEML